MENYLLFHELYPAQNKNAVDNDGDGVSEFDGDCDDANAVSTIKTKMKMDFRHAKEIVMTRMHWLSRRSIHDSEQSACLMPMGMVLKHWRRRSRTWNGLRRQRRHPTPEDLDGDGFSAC